MGRKEFIFCVYAILLNVTNTKTTFSMDQPPSHNMLSDHGRIDKKHIQAAEKFINSNLKLNGRYHPEKIKKFIELLEKEKESVKNDIYQTKLLEKIELDIRSFKKAKKDAKEEIEEDKNKTLRGYNEYLIPKIKLLLELVLKNSPPEKLDALVDEFIRGYIPYFVPNAYRSQWPRDINPIYAIKHMLYRFKFKKSLNSLEAFNLIVDQSNIDEINTCLTNQVQVNHYLSQEEINELKLCNIDISKIDPGISSLWNHISEEKRDEVFKTNPDFFPPDDAKIYLQRVHFRGHMSPKIKAYYMKDNKKVKFKLKMGQEVHTDHATSLIFELLGLNQDKMKYVPEVKVYLDDTSYEKFKSIYINKYGLEKLTRFVSGHGGEKGNEWILLKDVLYETRTNNELRISPFDFSSWDLRNRREYRSLLMLFAWIGLNNTKPANFKYLLEETDQGLIPLLRMQDLGSSLGGPSYLRKFKDIFSLFEYERVNAFPTTFLKSKNINEIRIDWNDFASFRRHFNQSTWYDMKWMARKIASLNPDHIHKALIQSGMALPVADIFRIKLVMRRNEMVQKFNLESEFPLIDVPNLKRYNPNHYESANAIKNGKVEQKVFPGKNTIVHVQPTWQTMLQQVAAFDLPVTKWREKETGHSFQTGLRGLEGLKASIGVAEQDAISAVTTIPLGIGVQAILSRRVAPNENFMNANDTFRIYKILDKVTFRFGLDSPMLRRAMNKIKFFSATAGIRFYEYKFSHIHYCDDIQKAYKSPFKLKKAIKNVPHFAAFQLKQLEVLREYSKVGIETDIGVGAYSFKPVLKNELSTTAGIRKKLNRYFIRDSYGQLHFFKDTLKDRFGGTIFNLVQAGGFLQGPALVKLNQGNMSFNSKMKDFVFSLPTNDREDATKFLTKERRKREYIELKRLIKNKKIKDSVMVKENYNIKSSGKSKARNNGLLYFINSKKTSNFSTSKVDLGKKTRKFIRYSVDRSKEFGSGNNSGLPPIDVSVIKRKRVRIITEMDRDEVENFVLIVRTQDFFRIRNKNNLESLIADLNRRFSKNKNELFYQGYVLPEEKTTKRYRKVYGLTRVFIDGKKLVQVINKYSEKDLEKIAKKYFSGNTGWLDHQKSYKIDLRKKLKINLKVKHTLSRIRKLKKILSDKKSQKEGILIAKHYDKLVNTLEIETYGLYFIKQLVGHDGLFVMGEISGVLNSYSGLTDLQQLQRRRFSGKSWGVYRVSPPLQKFLRYNRPVAPSVHIEKNISDSFIFGYLETSLAPNIEFLFGHDTNF